MTFRAKNRFRCLDFVLVINDQKTEILIESDNEEEELTSSGISEDEGEEDEENRFEEGSLDLVSKINRNEMSILGNILQPLNQYHHRTNGITP